jgi:uncharacterized protein (TIGR02646 family)
VIRIHRRASAPAALLTEGARHLAIVRQHAAAGTLRTDVFQKEVYSSPEVRELLWSEQHHKCCFCEWKYEIKWSTVEHFRPKTRADRGDGRVDAGYWWLCYDFSNLHFACMNCNAPKADYFPLARGSSPLAPEQHPDAHPEAALLLDPCRDDPEEHLTFEWIAEKGHYQIAPREGSERGRLMIRAAQLDRDTLTKLRNDYHDEYIAPVIEQFEHARDRGDAPAQQKVVEDARRFLRPRRPFVLLAKIALRRAGML